MGSNHIREVGGEILTGLGYKESEEDVDEMLREREYKKEVSKKGEDKKGEEEETVQEDINNKNYIRDISLTVYGFADKNTVLYIVIVLVLIGLYYIL